MRNRFLMAGLLALGVAACGDDVTVVEPTPPPPPPLTAVMAPASATVAVGNSVVFAVNASGGVAGESATWTCSSSNTGIATVSSTSTGCQATGGVAGDVTVTAAVSKSGETVNVGAELTVTSDDGSDGEPAFILIRSIKDATPDKSSLAGRVDVEVGIERGDQTLEVLSLLVDGEVVASQLLGSTMGMAPPEDEPAEQAVHAYTLLFDSDKYDMDTGDVTYSNGDHTVSAELQIAGSGMGNMAHETISSNAITVELDNMDGVHVATSGLGDAAMNAKTGELWYGGPDGNLKITAVPVKYSPGAVDAVTLLRFCGAAAMSDNQAPYEFALDCKTSTPRTGMTASFSLSSGGQSTEVKGSLNTGVFPLRLDYVGPTAPRFQVNPNNRELGWINASVSLSKYNASSNGNGWLVYTDTNADNGVGGYIPRIRYAKAPSNKKVSTARAADPMESLPTSSTKINEYCFVVTAVDLLGNESKLPKADVACAPAGSYMTTTGAMTTYAAGLLAGVDIVAPTIKFSPASTKANATSMKNFQVQVADEGSGIRAKAPVTAEAHVRDAKETDEIDPLGLSISLPLATTTGLPAGMGYYTFVAETADRAGNSSEEVMRTALHDTTPPQTNTIVGEYDEKTGRYSLVATVTDNLSIKEYWAEAKFGEIKIDGKKIDDKIKTTEISKGLFLPREGAMAVDAYNAADNAGGLTQAKLVSPFMVQTYKFLQVKNRVSSSLESIRIVARDHGANTSVHPNALKLTLDDEVLIDLEADAIGGDTTPEAGDYKVFQTLVAAAKESGGTVTLTATATGSLFLAPTKAVVDDTTTTVDETAKAVDGTQGLRDNPLTRVDFYAAVDSVGGKGSYALKFIGSVDGASAGAQDGNFDDEPKTPNQRRFIYAMEISKAAFLTAVGGKDDYGSNTDKGVIVAFGLQDNKALALQSDAADLYVKR